MIKVFGIGFHKTATTSLGAALHELGYRVCGPVGVMKPDLADTLRETAFEVVDDFDAFEDNPWPLLYRELDERYPGSQFILTTRAPNKWFSSVVNHFGGQSTPMRELIYGQGNGDPKGKEDIYLARYNRHNSEVLEYFKGRPSFMTMDITAGKGWDPLCHFVGRPIPSVAFPVLNTAAERDPVGGAPVRTYRKIAFPYGKPKAP